MSGIHDGGDERERRSTGADGARGSTSGWGWVSLTLARGILGSRYQRRQVMFFGMLFVMGQAFVGAVVLERVLLRHPVVFAVYWLFCFVAVMFVLMLALHDLLAVRREARERDRQLRVKMSESIRAAVEQRRREEDGEGGAH